MEGVREGVVTDPARAVPTPSQASCGRRGTSGCGTAGLIPSPIVGTPRQPGVRGVAIGASTERNPTEWMRADRLDGWSVTRWHMSDRSCGRRRRNILVVAHTGRDDSRDAAVLVSQAAPAARRRPGPQRAASGPTCIARRPGSRRRRHPRRGGLARRHRAGRSSSAATARSCARPRSREDRRRRCSG